MSTERRAEIVGGGFAGLAAAAALAQRGWRVRLHERADALRTEGAGIYIYENGLRVLEALGACDEAVAGAHIASTRETRDDRNRILSVHRWDVTASRVYSIVRQQVIDALAAAARRAGAEIVTGSAGVSATPQGELMLADGSRIAADLIVGADGVNSRIRDSLGLLRKRRRLADGAIRLLIDKAAEERAAGGDGRTIEYWSGSRRLVFTPCSDRDIYIALTMLNADDAATRVPVEQAEWTRSFPHLAALIARFGSQGHYAPFEWIRLKRWSAGRVAMLGDAAHALPPNIGQGAGCAMMNALSLAVHLDGTADIPAALAAWEARERPITEHTQRVSVWLGVPTTWPPALRNLTFRLIGKSKWLVRQRTKTALHRPTGTTGVAL
jgi:2-polyprenyl-6-methoxyphenol hydroxylase-like FAD-dependent oxidoreductase